MKVRKKINGLRGKWIQYYNYKISKFGIEISQQTYVVVKTDNKKEYTSFL